MMKRVGQATERRDRSRRTATIATLGVAAILATPYCGLLFGCGCTWPWSGLASQCSFFQPQSTIVCPWCEHPVAGIASVLLSAASAALVAAKMDLSKSLSQRSAIVVRTLIGTAVFLLVATAVGWATAAATDHPRFLISWRAKPQPRTAAHEMLRRGTGVPGQPLAYPIERSIVTIVSLGVSGNSCPGKTGEVSRNRSPAIPASSFTSRPA